MSTNITREPPTVACKLLTRREIRNQIEIRMIFLFIYFFIFGPCCKQSPFVLLSHSSARERLLLPWLRMSTTKSQHSVTLRTFYIFHLNSLFISFFFFCYLHHEKTFTSDFQKNDVLKVHSSATNTHAVQSCFSVCCSPTKATFSRSLCVRGSVRERCALSASLNVGHLFQVLHDQVLLFNVVFTGRAVPFLTRALAVSHQH